MKKILTENKKSQTAVFLALLGVYALSAFITYAFFSEQLAEMVGMPLPELGVPASLIGLANAAIVVIVYGILGLFGIWFARKLGLPGIYRKDGNWKSWFWVPLIIGLVCGVILVIGDLIFAKINDFGRFPHPGFPASILASISAGIGEEIAFRGFFFGLWAIILNWFLKRKNNRKLALWIANVLAALAFGAGHLGSIMILTGASTITEINPFLLIEIFLLNGIVGIAAGERYIKEGLVAASGVHFWTDVVFHVVWGIM